MIGYKLKFDKAVPAAARAAIKAVYANEKRCHIAVHKALLEQGKATRKTDALVKKHGLSIDLSGDDALVVSRPNG